MHSLPIPELAESIRQVFLNSGRYQMDKYIAEFKADGAYAGDCFNFNIFESQGDKPPIFYHIYSPYDVVSRVAPQRALVYQGGELLSDIDFAPYVPQRTGVMDAILLQGLGVQQLGRVLFVGTGRMASCALRALKAFYPDLTQVDYISASGKSGMLGQTAQELDITASAGSLADIGNYDYVTCHSSALQAVLTKEHLDHVKAGAVITSFASEDSFEIAEEYYNTASANVIVDWDRTLTEAAELQRAIQAGIADPAKMLHLGDVLAGKKPAPDARYTIYRSHGTPMQNLGVLQLLRHRP